MGKQASMRKIVLLLAAADGKRADFRDQLTAMAEKRPAGGQRWGLLLEPDEMETLPHQIVMQDSPPPYDALIEYDYAQGGAAKDAALGVVADLGDLVDPLRSNVLVCDEYRITTGNGPIFNGMPLRRVPALSHEEFMDAWFGRHAELGEGVEGVRYRQNHVVEPETSDLVQRLGFGSPPMDGLTCSFFDTIDAAVALLSSPPVRDGAIDDERTFIDHDRSQFGMYRTLITSLT